MQQVLIFSLLFFTLQTANALCVKANKANLRSGPGTKYEKTWEVFRYMPFRELEKKGKWYKVRDLDGDTHWIFHKLVTKDYNCAVIKVKKANLRTGPGTKYKKVAFFPSAEKYTSFKLLKTKGGWAHLLDEQGDKSWVSRKLVWVQ